MSLDQRESSRRRALKVAVCALCAEVGYEKANESAIETLTEMLQSLITEIGRSSKVFAELSGRTEGLLTDVFMALLDQGIDVESIHSHASRKNKTVFLPPSQSPGPPILKTLQTGDKQNHPAHIPDYLPAFPDPHSYIRTLTNKAPVTEYQIIREKAASQKRDIERALTRFIAKTGDTLSLFPDSDAYPLIAVKPTSRPYLEALLPKDTALEQDSFDDSSNERHKGQSSNQNTDGDGDSIDNPYLRPVKPHRYKKKGK